MEGVGEMGCEVTKLPSLKPFKTSNLGARYWYPNWSTGTKEEKQHELPRGSGTRYLVPVHNTNICLSTGTHTPVPVLQDLGKFLKSQIEASPLW